MKRTVNGNKNKKGLKILIFALSLILVFAATGLIYMQSMLNKINRPEPVAIIPPEDEFFEKDNDEEEDDITVVDPGEVLWPTDSEVILD